jgi:alpha-ketoglutarate-dependent taurine dioxygenase
MTPEPLPNDFGVVITDLPTARAPAATLRKELHALLRKHHLLVLRAPKPFDDGEQKHLTSLLGDPYPFQPETFVQHVHGNPFSYWHCDVVSSIEPPPQFTILHCLVRPEHGSCDTLFLPTAPIGLRLRAADRRAILAARTMLAPPVLMGRDLFSGSETLFFGSRGDLAPLLGLVRRARISEIRERRTKEESVNLKLLATIDGLADAARKASDSSVFRMKWREGDTVVWNNHTVCHRGGEPGVTMRGNRWMRRSLVRYAESDAAFYESFGIARRATPRGIVDVRAIDTAFKADLAAR